MRFIPVYTGNTHINNTTGDALAVYPCVYREHDLNKPSSIKESGLSLCIQGTRSGGTILNGIRRFIPVYTGNTFS